MGSPSATLCAGYWRSGALGVHRARSRLSLAALDYPRKLGNPRIKSGLDIVEVLLDKDRVREVRHLPNAFTLSAPFRYG